MTFKIFLNEPFNYLIILAPIIVVDYFEIVMLWLKV